MSENTTCPNCGRSVPPGRYCANCGAHMGGQGPWASVRPHAYAVNPSEHVLQPSVASAIFPHLPQQRSAPFRVALLVVAATLVLLGYYRLTGPFVAVTAAAIPALYGIYLYEIDLYEHEPMYFIGLTAGIGVVLGAIWALLTGHVVTRTLILMTMPQGAPIGQILLVAGVFPLATQALMLLGPIVLRITRPRYTVLDGFSFGAASALGFVFSSTVIYLLPELRSGPIAVASGTLLALRAVLHGLLVPLIDVGTTGVAAAALWQYGRTVRIASPYRWITSLWSVLLVAAVVQVGLRVADVLVSSSVAAILIYLGVALALLFWTRIELHLMLLTGAGGEGSGRHVLCPNCGHVGPDMGFCSNCGIAFHTADRPARGRTGTERE